MYNIKLESYVPEPSPATSDRIVAAIMQLGNTVQQRYTRASMI